MRSGWIPMQTEITYVWNKTMGTPGWKTSMCTLTTTRKRHFFYWLPHTVSSIFSLYLPHTISLYLLYLCAISSLNILSLLTHLTHTHVPSFVPESWLRQTRRAATSDDLVAATTPPSSLRSATKLHRKPLNLCHHLRSPPSSSMNIRTKYDKRSGTLSTSACPGHTTPPPTTVCDLHILPLAIYNSPLPPRRHYRQQRRLYTGKPIEARASPEDSTVDVPPSCVTTAICCSPPFFCHLWSTNPTSSYHHSRLLLMSCCFRFATAGEEEYTNKGLPEMGGCRLSLVAD